MVASGKAAKQGIILRSPRSIEKSMGLTDAVFDKTGTLTTGKMEMLEMVLINNPLNTPGTEISASELMQYAFSLESMDSHPIAAAISSSLAKQGITKLPITDFEQTPGSGVAGRVLAAGNKGKAVLIGSPLSIAKSTTEFVPEIKSAIERAKNRTNSVAVLAVDGLAYGVFELGDQFNTDGKIAIETLKKNGIKTWLLTGDSEASAISVGSKAGISLDHIFATATPEDKLNFVTSLQANGKVLMVGDGINDAAAIAQADFSIAMGSGTDTSIAAADITLMRASLLAAIEAINISKKSVKIIKSNLGWAFFYNLAFIPIAASGNLSPMYAAAAMSMSSVFVVLNSLRIK
jgi:Cu+-exporting ATPase